NLAAGRKLWSSRFGNTTSIRIPAREGMTEQSVARKLEQAINPADLGFQFLPVKRLSLTAAAGTTPFTLLFLAFSMFIIAAALMLVMILFKLGVDGRAAELGIVLAVGARRSIVRRVMLIEGGLVAVIGAAVGVVAGVGYAGLMLVGLKTWWLGAITTPFLQLYIDEHSVIHGFVLGVLASLTAIVWALRQTRQVSIRNLLSGRAEEARPLSAGRNRRAPWAAATLLIIAVALGFFATRMTGEEQAGTFMMVGMLVLAVVLTWIWDILRCDHGSSLLAGGTTLARLAW